MSDLHANAILPSLANFKANVAERRLYEAAYEELCPTDWKMPPRRSPWVYDLLLPLNADASYVVAQLNHAGIEAREAFKPMSAQREYGGMIMANSKAWAYSQRVIYLPLYSRILSPGEIAGKAFDVLGRAVTR